MRCVVADDSLIMRGRIKGYLTIGGHTIVGEADNSIEALELCKALKPEIAVFDILMPPGNGRDGKDAAIEYKKFNPDALVMVVTSNSQDALLKALEPWKIHCVRKPIIKEKFLRQLSREVELNGNHRPGSGSD